MKNMRVQLTRVGLFSPKEYPGIFEGKTAQDWVDSYNEKLNFYYELTWVGEGGIEITDFRYSEYDDGSIRGIFLCLDDRHYAKGSYNTDTLEITIEEINVSNPSNVGLHRLDYKLDDEIFNYYEEEYNLRDLDNFPNPKDYGDRLSEEGKRIDISLDTYISDTLKRFENASKFLKYLSSDQLKNDFAQFKKEHNRRFGEFKKVHDTVYRLTNGSVKKIEDVFHFQGI